MSRYSINAANLTSSLDQALALLIIAVNGRQRIGSAGTANKEIVLWCILLHSQSGVFS